MTRYFIDDCFAPTPVRGLASIGQGNPDGVGGPANNVALIIAIKTRIALDPEFLHEAFGREVAAGGVVLVQDMNRHTIRCGASGLG